MSRLTRFSPLALLLILPFAALGQSAATKKHALLVGINQYHHAGFNPPLNGAENDANEFAALLKEQGYAVTVLTGKDATRTAILAALKKATAKRGHDELVLVALAGHGVLFGAESYFCPYDAEPKQKDTMVGFAEIYDDLGGSGAGAKLLLVDACREGPRGVSKLPNTPDGVAVLLSCNAGEYSFETKDKKHGLFMYRVLEGFKGAAQNKRGEVTWARLRVHVTENVPLDVPPGGRQNPHEINNTSNIPALAMLKAAPTEDPLIREMKFVRVPKGTFWMGWDSFKKESKQVTIDADFELAAYTVTQGQWEAVMGNNPSWFSREGKGKDAVAEVSDADLKRFPVESVSWDDVQEFLKKLNEREQGKGWKYRLPKESEWEYACRGAATTKEECSYDFYFAKVSNDLSWNQANFNSEYPAGNGVKGKSLQRPTKVGQYDANKLGLHDMHGNVMQWCDDLSDGTGSVRVFRGGSWTTLGQFCRAAFRIRHVPSSRDSFVGFRLARVPSGG